MIVYLTCISGIFTILIIILKNLFIITYWIYGIIICTGTIAQILFIYIGELYPTRIRTISISFG